MNTFLSSILLFINVLISPVASDTDCLKYHAGEKPEIKVRYELQDIKFEDSLLKIRYSKDDKEYQISYLAGSVAKNVIVFAKVGDIIKYDSYQERPALFIIRESEEVISVRYFYLYPE